MQVLLGHPGKEPVHLLLIYLELLGDPRIVARQLVLARLELVNPLLQACQITRHRLEQLGDLGRQRRGCRWRVLRHALRGRRRLWSCRRRVDRSHLAGRRAWLRRWRSLLRRSLLRCRRRFRAELRCLLGNHLPGLIAIGGLPRHRAPGDARRQNEADESA